MGLAAMSDVFFSFTNKDEDTVLPLIDLVERSGFSVLHPGTISQGDSYRRMNDEIATCVVAFWSAAAAASTWAQAEMQYVLRAWSSNSLVLVAIDEEPLPVGLRDLPVIALRGSPETGEKELVERVRAVVSPRAAPAQYGDERLGTSDRASRWMIAFGWGSVLLVLFAIILLVLLPRAFPPTVHRTPEGKYLLLLVVMVLAVGAAIGGLAVWGWTNWSRRRWKVGSQPLSDTQYSR